MTEKEFTTSGINSWRFPNTTHWLCSPLSAATGGVLSSGWGEEKGRRMLQPWSNWDWDVIWKKQGDFSIFKSIWNLPRLEQVWDNPMSISWGIWRHQRIGASHCSPPSLPSPNSSLLLSGWFFPSVCPFLSYWSHLPLLFCPFSYRHLSSPLSCPLYWPLDPPPLLIPRPPSYKDHLAPVLSLHPTTPVLWGALVQWPQDTRVSSAPRQCSSPGCGWGLYNFTLPWTEGQPSMVFSRRSRSLLHLHLHSHFVPVPGVNISKC